MKWGQNICPHSFLFGVMEMADRIHSAIKDVHALDNEAGRDTWLNRVHPAVKLLVTLLFIALTASYSKYDLGGVIRVTVYPAALFILGDVSFGQAMKRLRFVLPFVLFLGILNPFFDRTVMMNAAGIPVSGGIISMLTLMLKAFNTVSAAYLLIATTSIRKICYALRKFHVPKIFVTELLLIYRYIILLLQEVERIRDAYQLRAPGKKGVALKAWGSLPGLLLLRSADRAERVYQSMLLRGFRGEYMLQGSEKLRAFDLLYGFAWVVVLFILRFALR